ncbi:MAG: dicarboxylate/amino acid:cation symporter [Candidatus Dadabacteria bacterium]|nr:MAG: dicarboxylate/amino acid:cation symporter [Candidatus Dadabacteria bacterium]
MKKLLLYYSKHPSQMIFAGMLLGLLTGLFAPQAGMQLSIIGELFLRALKLLIVPVIVVSMLVGVLNLEDSTSLGRLGVKALVYYASTTAIAVLIGLLMVNIIKPGIRHQTEQQSRLVQSTSKPQKEPARTSLQEVVKKIIPENIIFAAEEGNVLGLIFFSVFLGIALLSVKHEAVEIIKTSLAAVFDSIIWMVDKVMLFAAPGVFSLVAKVVAEFSLKSDLGQLGEALGSYALTVISGLLLHAIVALPLLAVYFKINPAKLFYYMFPALSTAFSTASSAATLPLTLECLRERAKIPDRIAGFVAPLGATVNMDGTAIYEAVAAVFIANFYGIALSFPEQFVVFLTATFSAVGAAGIPGAGLIMMTMVLDSVGIPAEGIALIVAIDRPLDMLRTSINVWGDSIGAAVVAKSEGETIFAVG